MIISLQVGLTHALGQGFRFWFECLQAIALFRMDLPVFSLHEAVENLFP